MSQSLKPGEKRALALLKRWATKGTYRVTRGVSGKEEPRLVQMLLEDGQMMYSTGWADYVCGLYNLLIAEDEAAKAEKVPASPGQPSVPPADSAGDT